jgi:hypothetical protein
VSRYRVLWLEIAAKQHRDLPADVRRLVDRRIDGLSGDPYAELDAIYDSRSDQWSVPVGGDGLLVYAVVQEPAAVIVLRIVVAAP